MSGEERECRCQIVRWSRDPYEPHIPAQAEWEQADDCPVHPILSHRGPHDGCDTPHPHTHAPVADAASTPACVPPAQPPAAPESDGVLATCDQDDVNRGIEWLVPTVERIVAERVRAVEGERDAARASLRLSMTSLNSACDVLLRASGLPADTDDIDLIEETVLGLAVRAESAEAAHEALRKGVEALIVRADARADAGTRLVTTTSLRVLLAGGAS